jgi:site-specific recombinase XerD
MPALSAENAWRRFVKERELLQGVTPATLACYACSWAAVSRYLPAGLAVADLERSHLADAAMELRKRGCCPVTVNSYLRPWNTFLRWAYREELAGKLIRLERIKEGEEIPKVLTPEDLRIALRYRGVTFSQQRAATLIALLLDTGLRISEAVSLDRSSVDLDQCTLTVLRGKGRKPRVVPISQECRRRLVAWLRQHEHKPLWPTVSGTRMKITSTKMQIQRLAARLGIRMSPHRLRHTFGTQYIANGGDAFRLQKVLGHATLKMTRRYVDLSIADLSAVHDEYSPLR